MYIYIYIYNIVRDIDTQIGKGTELSDPMRASTGRFRVRNGLKTPCGMAPPPLQFMGLAFNALFRQMALAVFCLSILWLILFDLWQILPESCLVVVGLRNKLSKQVVPKQQWNHQHFYQNCKQTIQNLFQINRWTISIHVESIREKGRFQDLKAAPSSILLAAVGAVWLLASFVVPFWAQLDLNWGPNTKTLGIMVQRWWTNSVQTQYAKKHRIVI